MRKRHYAVRVRWRDSATSRGWQSITNDQRAATIHSVGWMVKHTKDEVTLTTGISEEGHVVDPITIPRSCIDKITRLKTFIEGDE